MVMQPPPDCWDLVIPRFSLPKASHYYADHVPQNSSVCPISTSVKKDRHSSKGQLLLPARQSSESLRVLKYGCSEKVSDGVALWR